MVRRPIDLATVARRLRRGAYDNAAGRLRRDTVRIFSNCEKFNIGTSQLFVGIARHLRVREKARGRGMVGGTGGGGRPLGAATCRREVDRFGESVLWVMCVKVWGGAESWGRRDVVYVCVALVFGKFCVSVAPAINSVINQ